MSDEQDDAAYRAELVRRGIAVSGIARVGAMRSNVSLDTIVRRVLAEVAELRALVASHDAQLRLLRPTRQQGAATRAANALDADIALYKRVEARCRKTTLKPRAAMHSDLRSRKEPVEVRREREKILLPFSDLTPEEQARKLDSEMKKFYRGKRALADR